MSIDLVEEKLTFRISYHYKDAKGKLKNKSKITREFVDSIGLIPELSDVIPEQAFKNLHRDGKPAVLIQKLQYINMQDVKRDPRTRAKYKLSKCVEIFFNNGRVHNSKGSAIIHYGKNWQHWAPPFIIETECYIDDVRLLEDENAYGIMHSYDGTSTCLQDNFIRWYKRHEIQLDKVLTEEDQILRKLEIGI